jgi:two-component sensor histidine kinase
VDSEREQSFDQWDVDFLSTLANMLGSALARQTAEERAIESAAQNKRDQAHAEIMLRELQHRVKNNLQIIISLLTLKMGQMTDATVREKLHSVIGRVQAIALAHDLLSTGRETNSIDFADYLSALCELSPDADTTIEVHSAHAPIPLDKAVPAGLIVNELITNSLKYAFGNAGGIIRVTFDVMTNASEACIAVADDGIGIKLPPKKGFGLTLIEGLAHQLSGRIEYVEVDKGSRIRLCFPVAL